MTKKMEKQTFRLDAEAVDRISELTSGYFRDHSVEKRTVARCRLTVEEMLLRWLDKFGPGAQVTVSVVKRLSGPHFLIEIEGEQYDPFKEETENVGGFSGSFLRTIGQTPDYSFKGNTNRFAFKIKRKKLNPLLALLIAIGCAVILGSLGMLLPPTIRTTLLTSVFDPIHNGFYNALGLAAGPMIFLSVAWGIYGIGDTTTLSKIGNKLILFFIGSQFLITAVACLSIFPLFSLNMSGSGTAVSGFRAIFQMILDIIPTDIFSPFIAKNSLQIIFLAFIIGLAMLFLGKRTVAVATMVEQINYIVQFLMEFISTLVPYFIFIAVLRFIWSGTLSTLLGLTKVIWVYIACLIAMALIIIAITAIRYHVNPFLLLKKGLPTMLIAITTASSAACFGSNMNTCEKKFGMNPTITSFGVPLSMVMFKPSAAISYLVIALYFAERFNISCSVPWVILMVFVATILAIATPPIPGGALTAYTVLFLQLGIDNPDALAIVLAIDVVIDFLATGFDQFLLPFALASQAGRLGLMDSETLRSK